MGLLILCLLLFGKSSWLCYEWQGTGIALADVRMPWRPGWKWMEWSLLVSICPPKTWAKSHISFTPSAASEHTLLHHPRPGLLPTAASQAHIISPHSVLCTLSAEISSPAIFHWHFSHSKTQNVDLLASMLGKSKLNTTFNPNTRPQCCQPTLWLCLPMARQNINCWLPFSDAPNLSQHSLPMVTNYWCELASKIAQQVRICWTVMFQPPLLSPGDTAENTTKPMSR